MSKSRPNATPAPGNSVTSTYPNNFASSEELADARFNQWKSLDPFPEIDAALLNSADILAYVKRTSLIYPFDTAKLKGASYDVPIEGYAVYYDAKLDSADKRVIYELKNDDDYFDLPPNAIAFVTLQPTFRIPDYLALRFNLKITHIYKGLLLGTGPLVDPGFIGKLSIPLHNLTNNTYRFHKGDELITMEFTKMSLHKTWNPSARSVGHREQYIPNKIKPGRNVFQYISKALEKDGLSRIVSSIPAAMVKSEETAEAAKKSAEAAKESAKEIAKDAKELGDKLDKKAHIQAAVSIIAVCTLVLSAITLSLTSLNKANERYDAFIQEYSNLEKEYSEEIDELTQKITTLERQINSLLSSSEGSNSSDATESTATH